MSDTSFIDQKTVIEAPWLNDVNVTVYHRQLPSGHHLPTSEALAEDTGASLIGWKQDGMGAVARAVQDKARERVSIKDFGGVGDGVADDTAAVSAAVTYCLASGTWLFWNAIYLTTASIPNLHSVRHYGPGAIKRSGGLYYWDVADRDTVNIVYCASAGLDANDGIGPSQPMSVVAVKSYLENLGSRTLRGRWRVQFAAGTYTRGISSNKLPPFARYLELRGTSQSIQAWATAQAVAFGELRLAKSGAMLYRCVAPGTTGTTEPGARSTTVTDGTVIWSYIGGWLPWVTGEAIAGGDYRKNSGKVYVAKSSGTTGATGPTHSTGAVSDGAVSWAYVGLELAVPTLEGTTVFDGSLNPPAWSAGKSVQIGDARYNGTRCYRSRTAANTGATAPTHSSGAASDGSVTWEYIGERDTGVPLRGVDINPCPRLNVLYMKFHGFQNAADANAGGVILDGPTEQLLQYTVAGNCNMGAYHHGGASIYHQNTVYDACDTGIFAIYHIGATIGGPSQAQTTFIKNCNNGVYLSRESVAHIDYCVIDACRNDGVFASIMSRFRGVSSHFLRNNTAVYAIGASEWGDTPGSDCSFYLQTADANATKQRLDAFSRWADGSGFEHQYGGGELRYDWSWTLVTSTATAGDIATDVIVSEFKRLPAAWALDTSKKIRVVVRGALSGTAGTKSLKVALGTENLGGTGSIAAGTVGAFVMEVTAVPTGINTWSTSLLFETSSLRSIAHYTGLTAYVIDANGVDYNNKIRLYRNFAAAGDAVTINSVEVFITG